MSEALPLTPQEQPDLRLVVDNTQDNDANRQPSIVEQDLMTIRSRYHDGFVPDITQLDSANNVLAAMPRDAEGNILSEMGETVDADLVAEAQGLVDINSWRLDQQARTSAQNVLRMKSAAELTGDQPQHYQTFKTVAELEGRSGSFETYKKYAADRLALEKALYEREKEQAADAAPQSKPRPGQIGGVKIANHLLETTKAMETAEVDSHESDEHGTFDHIESSKTNANGTEAKPHDGIADIVNIDRKGNGHRQDGKFLSKHELDTITSFANEIRAGVSERDRILKLRENSKELKIRTIGQEEYDLKYANNPNVDPDAWKAREYGTAPKKNELPDDVTEDFWNRLPNEAKEFWGDLKEDEKENLRNFYADLKDAEAPLVENEDGMYDLRGKRAQVQSPVTKHTDGTYELRGNRERHAEPDYEPVTDTTPKGLKARFNKLVGQGWVKLQDLKNRAQDYYGDEEKGKRRKIVSGIVGAGVLISAGVSIALAVKSGSHVGTPKLPAHENLTDTPHGGAPSAHEAAKQYQEVKLKPGSGDSLWREERLHHAGETEKQIYNRVKKDLKMNGLTWKTARKVSGVLKITR